MARKDLLVAVLLLSAVGFSTAFVRSAEAQSADEVFTDTTDVIEVQVPVNVVSKDGEPVRGLTATDFEVFDGKTSHPIVDFREVDLSVLSSDASRREVESAVPSAARRHLLLLFDLSFSRPLAILRARTAARNFVRDSLTPADLVAVGIHSAHFGPRMLVTFTPDRLQVVRAIDTLGTAQMLDETGRDPLRFVIDNPHGESSPGISDPLTAKPSASLSDRETLELTQLNVIGKMLDRSEKSHSRGRIFSWATSLTDFARMLDSVKGRKHVVLFSEGFDGRLLLGRGPDAQDFEGQQDQFNIERGNLWMVDTDDIFGSTPLQNEMGSMLEEFRRADVVIQAVDISGLGNDSAAARRADKVGQDALFFLANETGGELFQDANRLETDLERLLKHTSVTYLVTIQPTNLALDGTFHPLKVRVDAPKGSRVYYRQGFYAPRPFEELHPFEKSLLASDAIAAAEARREIDINVLATPFRSSPTEAYVPVLIEVDGGDLLRDHKGNDLAVEFYTYVTNERGEMRDFFTQLVNLNLAEGREAFIAGGLKYYGHLDLGPGQHLVRVLVRNSNTGRAGVQTASVNIPTFGEEETVLLPPLFFEPAGRWVLVKEPRRAGYQSTVVYPFTINGEPFVPAARPLIDQREDARLCLVGYNLTNGELIVDGRVLDDEGRQVDGGEIRLIERTVTGISGLDKLLVDFRPQGLKTGDYRLRVAVRDVDGGTERFSSIPITVLN
jgi:VWFA-related protein